MPPEAASPASTWRAALPARDLLAPHPGADCRAPALAGLAAARALRLGGVEDFTLLELEDQPGGNSRAGSLRGIACPLGAHYLPVPGDDAPEVQDLLEELGLRQRVAGRWQYGGDDGRHLCHSPQERLFMDGQWQEGLLPLARRGRGHAGAVPALCRARGRALARRAVHHAGGQWF